MNIFEIYEKVAHQDTDLGLAIAGHRAENPTEIDRGIDKEIDKVTTAMAAMPINHLKTIVALLNVINFGILTNMSEAENEFKISKMQSQIALMNILTQLFEATIIDKENTNG